jgi:hypothetical protein
VALACGDAKTAREQANIALELAHRTGNQWTEARVQEYLQQLES